MKKEYMFCCLLLGLLLIAVPGTATASDCTMAVDMTSLQVSGPLDLFGETYRSYFFVGQVHVGPEIGLTLTSLNGLSSPPVCPNPSDEASVSFRSIGTGGLQVPSVLFGGSLYSTYVTVDLSTDTGTVEFPFTNLIAPLTMSDSQRGATSSAWNIYGAMSFNLLAGIAYDSFLFKNTQAISCNFGGGGTATYDPATNSSSIDFTNCGITSWAVCSGGFGVFPFPLSGRSSVMVTSPVVQCSAVFGDNVADITFLDSSSVITGSVFNLSGSLSGTLSSPTFTVPVNSNVQNLSMTVVPSGNDLIVFNIAGPAFMQCFGKWYAYDSLSNVIIHGDGTTTGNVSVVMPEISDTIQTVLNTDGTVEVDTNLSGLPGITRYPDFAALSGNCVF